MPPDFSIVTEMVKDPEAKSLLISIFKNGYVEVDDHSLQVVGRAFQLGKKTALDLYSPHPDPNELFDYSPAELPQR